MLFHTPWPSVPTGTLATSRAFLGMRGDCLQDLPPLHCICSAGWVNTTTSLGHKHHPVSHNCRTHPNFENAQIWKKKKPCILEIMKYEMHGFPTDSDDLFTCLFSLLNWELCTMFYWWPVIDHLWLIPKSLTHSSTCKCSNIQRKAAILCKTETYGFQRVQDGGKGEERKEWKAKHGFFVFSGPRPLHMEVTRLGVKSECSCQPTPQSQQL